MTIRPWTSTVACTALALTGCGLVLGDSFVVSDGGLDGTAPHDAAGSGSGSMSASGTGSALGSGVEAGDAKSDVLSSDAHTGEAGTTCADGIKDGAETDVDCGGGVCAACAVGKTCNGNADCTSVVCDPTKKICAASQCDDGIEDGDETDVDCGGANCQKCGQGKRCTIDADCMSAGCNAVMKTCDPDQCGDGTKDGDETAQDCGGPTCDADGKKCGQGDGCMSDDDCASGGCDVMSKSCVANQCSDGIKDGSETDVDCGGSCGGCAVGMKCAVDADCTSQGCDVTTMQCDATQCGDGLQDGAETDVDCGGSVCDALGDTCALGKKCGARADCASQGCDFFTGTCTCVDGIKDGTETDVDCGGAACDGAGDVCAVGKACSVNADCVAPMACDATTKLCDADTCSDGIVDGTETDVDCGGTTCDGAGKRCGSGKKCSTSNDCSSHNCRTFGAGPHTCS